MCNLKEITNDFRYFKYESNLEAEDHSNNDYQASDVVKSHY